MKELIFKEENYLKVSKFEAGILINFGAPSLEWKRMVLTSHPVEPVDLRSAPKNSR